MKILKLANQSGITVTKKSNNDVSYEYLADFAQAVIEDYKTSLVPVAYMYQHDETGRTTFRGLEERMVERRWFEIPLYALGETK